VIIGKFGERDGFLLNPRNDIFSLCPSRMDLPIIILIMIIESLKNERTLTFASLARIIPHKRVYASSKLFDDSPRPQENEMTNVPLGSWRLPPCSCHTLSHSLYYCYNKSQLYW
jgi:hypothetical protein